MACPFCGCFNGFSGSPGYEPGDDDFARAARSAELFARAIDGNLTEDEREEMRGIARDPYGDVGTMMSRGPVHYRRPSHTRP